jgi:hypothetical protein
VALKVVCARDGTLHPQAETVYCTQCGDLLMQGHRVTGSQWQSNQWPHPTIAARSTDVDRRHYMTASHRAYLAAMELVETPREWRAPARVRSRVGMERLLRKTFGHHKNRPLVHWSWPAATVARAHRAKNWP